MLAYNEVKEGRFVVFGDEPWQVLSSHVFRKQQRKPVNAVKMRNLLTGKVIEQSFHQSERIPEAEIEEKESLYLYSHRGEHWFADKNDKRQRFKLDGLAVGDQIKFIPQNSPIAILSFRGKIIGLRPPIKVALTVKEAPPDLRGNTAQGGTKKVVLETGAEINAPMFVKEGDRLIVNTQTGEYVSRA